MLQIYPGHKVNQNANNAKKRKSNSKNKTFNQSINTKN